MLILSPLPSSIPSSYLLIIFYPISSPLNLFPPVLFFLFYILTHFFPPSLFSPFFFLLHFSIFPCFMYSVSLSFFSLLKFLLLPFCPFFLFLLLYVIFFFCQLSIPFYMYAFFCYVPFLSLSAFLSYSSHLTFVLVLFSLFITKAPSSTTHSFICPSVWSSKPFSL